MTTPVFGRGSELNELDFLLKQHSVMAMIIGRRVGKTTLLVEWMK